MHLASQLVMSIAVLLQTSPDSGILPTVADIKAGLARVTAMSKTLQLTGTVNDSGVSIPGRPAKQPTHLTIDIFQDKLRVIAKRQDEKSYLDRLYVSGTDSQFVLRRQIPGSTYYLEYETIDESAKRYLETFTIPVQKSLFSVDEFEILSLLEDPSFNILSISPDQIDGDALVRLEFKLTSSDAAKKPSLEGRVVLDPGRSYAVRAFDVIKTFGKRSIQTTAAIVFGPGKTDLTPVTIQHKYAFTLPKPRLQMHEFKAETWSFSPPDPAIFTKDYYGLGMRPAPDQSSGLGIRAWCVIIAIVTSCLGLGARWLSRRQLRRVRPD